MAISRPRGRAPFAKRDLHRFVDASGGKNDKVSPMLIADNEVADVQNFNYLEKGTLQKRHGYTRRYASTFASGPVRGLYNYRKEDGTSRLVMGADDKIFYDTPNFNQVYDLQADWDMGKKDGTTSIEVPGDIKAVIGTFSTPGNIVAGKRGGIAGGTRYHREKIWKTNTLDISAVGDKSTGKVTFSVTLPTSTTAVVETRVSNDGVTWDGWLALGGAGAIQGVTTKTKLEVRVRFNSTAGLRASAQILTVTFDQTATVTTLASGLSTTARYDFATANDTLWIVNGANTPKKWDGTTYGDMGGSPPVGKFIIFHKQRLFIGGTAANRSRLYFTDVGAPETWGALSFIDVGKGDGDAMTGFGILNDRLEITKDNSVWELAGDAPSNFILRQTSTQGGSVVKQSMALVKDTLIWIGKAGVYLFDGVRSVLGSEKISVTFGNLNSQQFAQAAGVFWQPEQHYFLSVPDGSSLTNNKVLVFDALRTAWSIYVGIPAGEWCVFRQFNKDTLIFGDSTKGQIYTWDSSGYSDDGAAIDAYVVTKAFTLAGGIEAPALVPDVFIACSEPSSAITTVNASFFKDLGAETATIPLDTKAQPLNVLRAIPSVVGVSLPRALAIKVRHNILSKGLKINAIDIRFSPKTLRAT